MLALLSLQQLQVGHCLWETSESIQLRPEKVLNLPLAGQRWLPS